jgi:hypothetical protein
MAASAVTVDFTSSALVGGAGQRTVISGPYDLNPFGVDRTVTFTANKGFVVTGDGTSDVSPRPAGFALDFDGIGIDNDGLPPIDDEVLGTEEILTVTFNGLVSITGIHLLDFFARRGSETTNFEVAVLNGVDVVATYTFFAPANPDTNPGGYFFAPLSPALVATAITLTGPSGGLGGTFDDGTNDFALAGLDITAVPLPASVLLLLGALGGFAMVGRRRAAA